MTDSLTKQIIEQLNHLTGKKKKAVLELIRPDDDSFKKSQPENFKKEWQEKLLRTSVWSENEIAEIHKAREYINTWQLKPLS